MELTSQIDAQRSFFHLGYTRSVSFRRTMLHRLKQGLDRHEAALLAALEQDLGKSRFEAYETELAVVRSELKDAWEHLERWARPRKVRTPLALAPGSSRAYREPYGVALIMAPWNYPVQLTLVPLISALAAGCTAVVKPSAYAPASSQAVADLIADVFEPNYVCAVQGGRAENTALLKERFDFLFFTGSTAVGRTVMAAAAERLTPVALELGGKSPAILAPDADMDLAARRIVWGKGLNAGQTCVAPDHVWVPEEARDYFVERLGRYIRQFYGEQPLESPDLPRIVNEKHFRRLEGLMASGRIALGGGRDASRLKIAPTVLVDVDEGDPVMGEEIFGPILPVLTYDGDMEALIGRLQQKPRPLALYLFTKDSALMREVRERIPFGGGCVNDTVIHLANSALPFGGTGESGMGRCHGEAGFRTFSYEKSVYRKFPPDVPVRYPPHGGKGLGLLKRLMG